jgi:hypothetical protein
MSSIQKSTACLVLADGSLFYGYGFGITNDLSSFGHGGGGAGISTGFKIWPETGTVMVTLFNLDPSLATEFNARVIEAKMSDNKFTTY